ncbi:MAG: hypothetical protein ACRDH1_03785 [Actinomycetota bacterium]
MILGGTAVALPGKNSVFPDDIKKKAVKTKHIAKNAVKTSKIANDAVTGGKADEASFQGLVFGQGEQYTRTFTVDGVGFLPDPKPVIAEVPTMGVVEVLGCFGAPNYSIRTRLLSFDDAQPFFGVGTVTGSDLPSGVNPAGVVSDQTAGPFGSGGGSPLIANGGSVGTAGHFEWSLWRGTGDDVPGAHVSIDGYNDAGVTGPIQCHITATVYQN